MEETDLNEKLGKVLQISSQIRVFRLTQFAMARFLALGATKRFCVFLLVFLQ